MARRLRSIKGERTAENHTGHILEKLGAQSRAQVAAWAAAHGLSPEEPSGDSLDL